MKFKHFLIVLLSLIALSGCVSVHNESKQSDVLKKDTLKIGMELEYAPFETIDASGNPSGFSVAYAKKLGEALNKKVEIVALKYDALIPALENKTIDMIISSMSPTEERKRVIDFSESYTKASLYALTSENAQITTLDQINNERVTIAVKSGTLSALWVSKNATKATVKSFESMDAALLDVANGQSQVALYDPLSIYSFQEKHPQTKVLPTPITDVEGWAIALPKGDTELKVKVDDFVKKSKTDGTIEELKKTYLQDELKKFEKYGIPFIV